MWPSYVRSDPGSARDGTLRGVCELFSTLKHNGSSFMGLGMARDMDLNDEDLMIQFSGVKICRRFGDFDTKSFLNLEISVDRLSMRLVSPFVQGDQVKVCTFDGTWDMLIHDDTCVHSTTWGSAMQLWVYMGVSWNSGTPKSSILIGFFIINHPFWGTTIFGNTHIYIYMLIQYIVVVSIWW